jgi:plasmid stabilization system protein ParE
MTYSLSAEAAEELEEAFLHYQEHASSKVAQSFLDEFERAAALVDEYPGIGTKASNGRRIFPLRRYPYSLVYRSAGEEGVRIGAVAHQSRGPKYQRQARAR